MTTPIAENPPHLGLRTDNANPVAAMVLTAAKRPVERLLSLERIRSLYERVSGLRSGKVFLDRALDVLEIDRGCRPGDLERIPGSGPVVLVSNHPFGVVDPMAVLSLVLTVRPDAMVLGNHLLLRIPELHDLLIPIDPFRGKDAVRRNTQGIRRCLRLLREGRMLCMFPAGTVSHLHVRPGLPRVTDPPWNTTAARLALKTEAVVVPAHVSGRNSALFQMAGIIHPALRTVLLPRETVKKLGGRVQIRIGRPVPSERLRRFSTDEERTRFLRSRSYLLSEDKTVPSGPLLRRPAQARLEQLQSPQPSERLLGEVQRLPSNQCLVQSGPFQVLLARSRQIPALLEEIGRLRERTFRVEGEGTGRSTDTDRFDQHYRHLILWNHERCEVAGAYRLGLSEDILPRFGPKGLYTRSLFHYGMRFLNRIGPAVELGRSFVCIEYQRSFQPLFLLWKGIARFVSIHPQYRCLFGPVSITRSYRSRSRGLMAAFFRENNGDSDLARLVRPRHPFRTAALRSSELRNALEGLQDVRELSELISEIEEDRKGVPVLIRQYLRLGGVVLGFNLDPDFRDALDALVLVDLMRTRPRTLSRYMGREPAGAFLEAHAAGLARCA